MCGIVGYVGTEQAAPILLAGLSKLEYRGYDSAGIAIRNEDTGDITVVKAKGRLKILSEKTNEGHAVPGTCGIGHTRWATHGEPSENNAHPHCTDDKSVVLVHNGIIENYQELKDKLIKSGYAFYSQTDTEIAVKLVDYYYRKTGTPLEAISRAMLRIRGSYAFGIMFHDHPGKIFAARKDSPLIIGKSQTGCLIASDVPAILDKTRNVYYIGNHEIAELSQDEIHFYNIDREEIQKEQVEIKWDAESAEKGGYEHFMLKEMVVIVSQSGETADSLAALRLAKERKIPVLGIVNVVGSSIARESDYILYTYAGPEISVATTKAYSTQLIAMYLLAIQAAKVKDVISEERYAALIEELGTLPEKIQKTLDDKERIQWFASKYANAKDVFFIGRGIDYAISMEGSLKMKEISYIHSEAYAAGELKHGTISLIEDGILVVGVATQAALFEKTISNMVEVKSRGAYLMGLTTYGNYNIEDTADFAVYVPQTESFFATSLAIVPLQLMGYYVSVAKGLDVDKPRNLAKSVTVE